MNAVFVKTAKAEREWAKLPLALMRILSLMDGSSASDELAKRAAPSLRITWDEHLNQLLKGGYIVVQPETVPKHENAPRELNLVQKKQETATVQAKQAPATIVRPGPDPVVKHPDDNQQAEKTARTEKLRAYFAAAKEKAKFEAEQAAHDDALLHAKLDVTAATTAKANPVTEVKIVDRQNERNAAHVRAEIEAAIEEAKIKSGTYKVFQIEPKQKVGGIEPKQKIGGAEYQRVDLEADVSFKKIMPDFGAKFISDTEVKATVIQTKKQAEPARAEPESAIPAARAGGGSGVMAATSQASMTANEATRLSSLEIENEALKQLLAEEYYLKLALRKTSQS